MNHVLQLFPRGLDHAALNTEAQVSDDRYLLAHSQVLFLGLASLSLIGSEQREAESATTFYVFSVRVGCDEWFHGSRELLLLEGRSLHEGANSCRSSGKTGRSYFGSLLECDNFFPS